MSKIVIVTDSDSSLPGEVAFRNHIHLVPIGVNFGSESFEAGVNIDDKQLFERADRENKLPTTAAPTIGNYSKAFQTAFDVGFDEVVCICVSSEVSATYTAAMQAKDLFSQPITVIDSRNLCLGQGYMALAAAEAAQRGEPAEKVVAAAVEMGKRVHYYGALSTLKYLAMSGRVGYVAAGMAGLLNIKPILTIRDGKLEMLEKIRTRKKALSRLIELVNQDSSSQRIERMALIHVNALAETKEFEKQLRASVNCPAEIMYCELGPGLSVHTGAGLIAVAFVL